MPQTQMGGAAVPDGPSPGPLGDCPLPSSHQFPLRQQPPHPHLMTLLSPFFLCLFLLRLSPALPCLPPILQARTRRPHRLLRVRSRSCCCWRPRSTQLASSTGRLTPTCAPSGRASRATSLAWCRRCEPAVLSSAGPQQYDISLAYNACAWDCRMCCARCLPQPACLPRDPRSLAPPHHLPHPTLLPLPRCVLCSVLMNTALGGQLPLDAGLWSELRSVQNLNLANTGLSGFLPAQIDGLTTVQFISLGGNQLEGELGCCLLVFLFVLCS